MRLGVREKLSIRRKLRVVDENRLRIFLSCIGVNRILKILICADAIPLKLVFIITYIICTPRGAGEACGIIQLEAYPEGRRRFTFSSFQIPDLFSWSGRTHMWHIWELPPKFLEIQAIVLLRKAYGRISNTQRKTFGEACKERSGEFPPYYDTTNSARDLHTIMKATGAKKVTTFWTPLFSERRLQHSSLKHSITSFSTVLWTASYNTASGMSSLPRSKMPKKPFRSFWFLLQSWARAVHSTQTLPKRSVRYEKVEKKLINSPVLVPGLGTFNYTVQHHLITGVAIDPNNFFPFLAAVLAEAERGTAGDLFPL